MTIWTMLLLLLLLQLMLLLMVLVVHLLYQVLAEHVLLLQLHGAQQLGLQ
jgi:hypothetical protein